LPGIQIAWQGYVVDFLALFVTALFARILVISEQADTSLVVAHYPHVPQLIQSMFLTD
jgi:hypothetical protein